MRVLLHTPLKSPDHPVPSGDREMARGLRRLLRRLGHKVVAPKLSQVAAGVPRADAQLAAQRRARAQAGRLIDDWRAMPARHPGRFDLWFTYHCYYRKPDWLGPLVSRALGIPYVIVEASHSLRRGQGPWRLGHRAVERALAAADLVLTVNPNDIAGVRPRLAAPSRQVRLPPFIDVVPLRHGAAMRAGNRSAVARRFGLDPDVPWLLSVGMMRARAKLDSYRVLADALKLLAGRPWQALIVGDGPARGEIEALMAPLGARVAFAGALPHRELPVLYAAADLYLWPAINEAYGMAFLEAQAAGLPVIAGRTGGVPAVVSDGETGLLTSIGDARAFAVATGRLLGDPERRAAFAAAASRRMAIHHDEVAAAGALKFAIAAMMARQP